MFHEIAIRQRIAEQKGLTIDLSKGSPDMGPPEVVLNALKAAVSDSRNYGYTLTGIEEFHEAVAYFYRQRYGVKLDPRTEVLQLIGSQDGLAHLPLSLMNPGDIAILPDPGYPVYEAGIKLAGGIPYLMPLLKENSFYPDFDSIPTEIAHRAKLMYLNYPGNPVNVLADEAFFRKAVDFAKRYNILLVHDFAYSELVFDGKRSTSLLAIPGAKDVSVEFNSLSKTFNMAGCRIGYIVGNEHVLQALELLKSNIDFGVFLPIQKAAVAALTSDYSSITETVKIYQERRDIFTSYLAQGGWKVEKPSATMFLWSKVPRGWTGRQFVFDVLEHTGVALTPGDAFGEMGKDYVRIALVQPIDRLIEAGERIQKFLSRFTGSPVETNVYI